jgi:hypothetical protein
VAYFYNDAINLKIGLQSQDDLGCVFKHLGDQQQKGRSRRYRKEEE